MVLQRLRIYASAQTHSSVDKSVRLSGIGQDNLIKIEVDQNLSMDATILRRQIEADLAQGLSYLLGWYCVLEALPSVPQITSPKLLPLLRNLTSTPM